MSRKLLITLGAASVVVVAGVASAGIVAYNSCQINLMDELKKEEQKRPKE